MKCTPFSLLFRSLKVLLIVVLFLSMDGLSYARSSSVRSSPSPSETSSLYPSLFSEASPLRPSLLHIQPMLNEAMKMQHKLLLPCLGSTTLPLCYTPQQIQRIYGISALHSMNIAGRGRTIVIVDVYQNPTIGADLELFDLTFGLRDPSLHIFAPFGLHPFDPTNPVALSFALEIALDVEWAHAIAPDATIDLVLGNPTDYGLQSQLDALIAATKYAVDSNLGDVVSLSVGLGESCYSVDELQSWHTIFQTAYARKMSVFVASGDSGSAVTICDRPGHPVANGQGVEYPASDPLVTGVGGTTLRASRRGVYESEAAWNNSATGGGAGGGGFSELFPTPDYQKGIAGISQLRGVPDVSYNADPMTSFPVITSSYLEHTTVILPVGGTSAGAPQWAGVAAIVDQATQQRLGFLNGDLYRLGQSEFYTKSFHDITVGNNAFTYQDTRGQRVTVPGFEAVPGWDASTGLGSPNVSMLTALLLKSQPPVDVRSGS